MRLFLFSRKNMNTIESSLILVIQKRTFSKCKSHLDFLALKPPSNAESVLESLAFTETSRTETQQENFQENEHSTED